MVWMSSASWGLHGCRTALAYSDVLHAHVGNTWSTGFNHPVLALQGVSLGVHANDDANKWVCQHHMLLADMIAKDDNRNVA